MKKIKTFLKKLLTLELITLREIKAKFNAFTLVELAVTLVVISIIFSALTPTISKRLSATSTLKNKITTECDSQYPDGFCAMCYLPPISKCITCTRTCASNQFKNEEKCVCEDCSSKFNDSQCSKCNSKACMQCKQGYYLDDNHKCTICPKGYKCYQKGDTSIKEPCAKGTIASNQGQKECTNCPASSSTTPGSIAANTGMTSCTTCPNGQYASIQGASSCTTCPLGSYCVGGKITPCAKGTAQNKTGQTSCFSCAISSSTTPGSIAANTGMTSCTTCPNGQYASIQGASSCTTCPLGSYCVGGKITPCAKGTAQNKTGQTSCTPCAKATSTISGSIAANTGMTSCTLCADGKYTTQANQTTCSNCPQGYACPGGKLIQCAIGTYSPGGKANCIACGSGKTSAQGASACVTCNTGCSECYKTANNCTSCKSGYYKSGSSCQSCPAGYYCPGGSSGKTICPIGTYSNAANGSCTNCGSGKTSTQGASSCVVCNTGCSECYQTANNCTSCKPGYYRSGSSCAKCNIGYYCPGGTQGQQSCGSGKSSPQGATSASQCVSCGAGCSQCSNTTTCSSCNAGYYKNSSTCSTCTQGYYCPGGVDRIFCGSGKTSPQGATSASQCTTCNAGCSACSGTKSNCSACSPGYYISGTTCYKCTAGYYCPGGTLGRIKCSVGTYSSAGASSCSTCASGQTSAEGASRCSFCITGCAVCSGSSTRCSSCSAGYYINGTACTRCPAGYYCVGGTVGKASCGSGKTSDAGASSINQCKASFDCVGEGGEEIDSSKCIKQHKFVRSLKFYQVMRTPIECKDSLGAGWRNMNSEEICDYMARTNVRPGSYLRQPTDVHWAGLSRHYYNYLEYYPDCSYKRTINGTTYCYSTQYDYENDKRRFNYVNNTCRYRDGQTSHLNGGDCPSNQNFQSNELNSDGDGYMWYSCTWMNIYCVHDI